MNALQSPPSSLQFSVLSPQSPVLSLQSASDLRALPEPREGADQLSSIIIIVRSPPH